MNKSEITDRLGEILNRLGNTDPSFSSNELVKRALGLVSEAETLFGEAESLEREVNEVVDEVKVLADIVETLREEEENDPEIYETFLVRNPRLDSKTTLDPAFQRLLWRHLPPIATDSIEGDLVEVGLKRGIFSIARWSAGERSRLWIEDCPVSIEGIPGGIDESLIGTFLFPLVSSNAIALGENE